MISGLVTDGMERKRITCPLTAHLEEIDLERTALGILIVQCSRFSPRCAIECERECARRMDERDRRLADDLWERVLVLVPAGDVKAGTIADVLVALLSTDGFTVERGVPNVRTAPPPPDYDAIVLGASTRHGHLDAATLNYVTRHREELVAIPSFLFTVGALPAAVPGWVPRSTASFSHRDIAQYARIQAFADVIADEVPAVGADFSIESAKPVRDRRP